MMMLPQHILDRFARIPHNAPIKNEYYGVFNRILSELCFPEDHFTVQPHYLLPEAGTPPIDFVVEVNNLPVFFLEIETPLHINHISTRVDADTQMRAIFRGLYNLTRTPRLHGISVMGQKFAFYCLDKATSHINPDHVTLSTNHIVTDTVPAERWDIDITTEDGYQKFIKVINDVKGMAAML